MPVKNDKMRLSKKWMDARRKAQQMVIPFASFATPQTSFCAQTLRDSHARNAWRCFSLLIWNNQTSQLATSPARNAWLSHFHLLLA